VSETIALKDSSLVTDLQSLLTDSTPTRAWPEATHRGILGESVEGMKRWMYGDMANPASMSVKSRTTTKLGRWTTAALDVRLITPAEFADRHVLPFTRGAAVVMQGALSKLTLIDDRAGGRELETTDENRDELFGTFTKAAAEIAANPLDDQSPVAINLEVLRVAQEEREKQKAEQAGLLPAEERLHAA
jgi:hypothetical protein